MKETIILFEDEGYSQFLPLVYTRPVYELRCGVFTLRERVAALLGTPPAAICRPHLASVYGAGRWPLGLLADTAPLIFVNGRACDLAWLPDLLAAPLNTVFVTPSASGRRGDHTARCARLAGAGQRGAARSA